MDQDFYIEETSLVKVTIVIILVLALIGGGLYYYFNYFTKNTIRLNKMTVELGMPLSNDINDYAKGDKLSDYTLDLSNIKVDDNGNTVGVGEYSYKLINGTTIKRGKLFVKDSTKPLVNIRELTVGVKEEFEPAEFVESCTDLSLPCKVRYKNNSDSTLNEKDGTYKFKIIVSDNEGNELEKDVTLNVSKNKTLKEVKESDLNAVSTSNESASWNKTYTVKFDKALDEESLDFEGKIQELSAKEYEFDKKIKDKEIITIYNKYGFALGLSIKVTFEDDTEIFVTPENAVEIAESE